MSITILPLYFPVKVEFTGDSVPLPVSLQSEINAYWQEALKSSPRMTNGTIFHVHLINFPTATTPYYHFLVRKTNYAHYIFSRRKLSEDSPFYCRTLFASSIILSADDHFIFGHLREDAYRPGYLQPVGGSVDLADLVGTEVQLERTIQREMLEEIGVDLREQGSLVEPAYLKRNGNDGVIFRVRLKLTSEEILGIFRAKLTQGEIDEEFQNLVAVPKKEIRQFLEQDNRRRVEHLSLLLQEG